MYEQNEKVINIVNNNGRKKEKRKKENQLSFKK